MSESGQKLQELTDNVWKCLKKSLEMAGHWDDNDDDVKDH